MLKPVSADAKLDVVWPHDPAVDQASSDIDGYRANAGKAGHWKDYIQCNDGQKPTIFVVGVIPPDEYFRIQDECMRKGEGPGMSTMFWRCFVESLRDVVDGPSSTTRDPSGVERCEVPKRKVGSVDYVSREWARSTFTMSLKDAAIWVGSVALGWNSLSEDDIKNS